MNSCRRCLGVWRIRLHDRDLEMVHALTTKRQLFKRKLAVETQKYDRKRTDWEIAFYGFMGEVAVARALCLSPDETVLAGGDGGVDLVINNTTLQVKTPLTKATKDFLYFNDETRFNCDFGVLCNVDSDETAVLIRGAISRVDFIHRAAVRDFGYGERLVVHASELLSMDDLIRSIQSHNELTIGEPC
jgi:hypothetical protein